RRRPALPQHRCLDAQGAVPALGTPGLRGAAAQAGGTPRAGRHPRVDRGARLLPRPLPVAADHGRGAAGVSRFDGKVAIVTGGGGNIGAATAMLLAVEGARVTVADVSLDRAESVVAAIVAVGGTARAQAVDVADPAQVEDMITETIAAYDGLDVLH